MRERKQSDLAHARLDSREDVGPDDDSVGGDIRSHGMKRMLQGVHHIETHTALQTIRLHQSGDVPIELSVSRRFRYGYVNEIVLLLGSHVRIVCFNDSLENETNTVITRYVTR